MNRSISVVFLLVFALFAQSCVVVRQDEIAMKRRFGKLSGKPLQEGARAYNPLFASYLKVPVRNINMEINLEIPSKEGLTIGTEISIIYRIDPNKVQEILRSVGVRYERDLISPVFRSALADVSSRFMAKDMHTGKRSVIEQEVKERMMSTVGSQGFIIESVLMKRIVLPRSLSDAIEEKLSAEQDAQRMEFVLLREKQEAERRQIEATGISNAQRILSEGLSDAVLRYQAIEAFRELSKSPNAKVIFSNTMLPMLLDEK